MIITEEEKLRTGSDLVSGLVWPEAQNISSPEVGRCDVTVMPSSLLTVVFFKYASDVLWNDQIESTRHIPAWRKLYLVNYGANQTVKIFRFILIMTEDVNLLIVVLKIAWNIMMLWIDNVIYINAKFSSE